MGLTSKPSKNIDLSKIDDIQSEFFGDENIEKEKNGKNASKELNKTGKPNISKNQNDSETGRNPVETEKSGKEAKEFFSIKNRLSEDQPGSETDITETNFTEIGNLKIADLLATAKIEGVRYSSRPFTVPRSLTIDLTRLKAKFRTRDLQYTQNELMDKMIKESLEIITADNYFSLREKALKLVKSPEQSSRRSVTLTEETVSGMAELKADLGLKLNRRISSDEIFTTLLAVAFSSLYENGLL